VAGSKSSWGSTRKLPSGRWQARYRVERVWRVAPTTYRTKRDAESFLATTRAALERGSWVDPQRGRITLRAYRSPWLANKVNLRPRTKEQYEINLRLHILPGLGETRLSSITPTRVREWNAALLLEQQLGPPTAAKCYRLLHGILATAVEDELITRNPCVLRGLATSRAAERPTASIEQVYELAEAITPSLRMMVLLATFTGLRLGELRALRRCNLDLDHRTLRVVEQLQELSSGQLVVGPPKTAAGVRTVSIPEALIEDLRTHLVRFGGDGADGLVFCGTRHQPLHRKTFYRHWRLAVKAVSLEGFRFHDLRHTGNTLAAATGASTRELMSRMGHASPRAALIYQHSTPEREARIAAALSDQIREHAQGDNHD
jgi:integrase